MDTHELGASLEIVSPPPAVGGRMTNWVQGISEFRGHLIVSEHSGMQIWVHGAMNNHCILKEKIPQAKVHFSFPFFLSSLCSNFFAFFLAVD
jgi:hypothetical protein